MDHHQPTAQKHHLFSLPIIIKNELVYAVSFIVILISPFFVFYLLDPFEPHQLYRFGFLSQILLNNKKSSCDYSSGFLSQILPNNKTSSCDYSHGRWVRMTVVTNFNHRMKPAHFSIPASGAVSVEGKT